MPIWPLAAYAALVGIVVASMLGLSALLGERHRGRARDDPYESGLAPTGSARARFPVHFYLVAMFFVIFDVEAVFVFAWAVCAREVGVAGYVEILVFVGVLLAALAYLWKDGALDVGAAAAGPRPEAGGREAR